MHLICFNAGERGAAGLADFLPLAADLNRKPSASQDDARGRTRAVAGGIGIRPVAIVAAVVQIVNAVFQLMGEAVDPVDMAAEVAAAYQVFFDVMHESLEGMDVLVELPRAAAEMSRIVHSRGEPVNLGHL